MRIIAIANQKGGVGKTTTTVNSGFLLATRGLRTLVVDLDPQGNTTSSFGIDKASLGATAFDVLVDNASLDTSVVAGIRPGLDVLPATPMLAGAEIELVPIRQREYQLRKALASEPGGYDIVLIDCPPSLGLLTVNALTAANAVVIPIQCEFLALEGVTQLITTIDLVHRQLNPGLDLLGVLMTMYDGRTRLSTHVVEEVRRFFPDRMFNDVVPRSVRLAEAPSYGQSIAEYDASSRGAVAYHHFVDELLVRLGIVHAADRSLTP